MSHTSNRAVTKAGGPAAKPQRAEPKPTARGASSPQSAAAGVDPWQRASQVAVLGLFVIAVLWCAYVAQPVLVPVLLAWAIATIVLPIVKWMQSHGVPRVLAAILVTL